MSKILKWGAPAIGAFIFTTAALVAIYLWWGLSGKPEDGGTVG